MQALALKGWGRGREGDVRRDACREFRSSDHCWNVWIHQGRLDMVEGKIHSTHGCQWADYLGFQLGLDLFGSGYVLLLWVLGPDEGCGLDDEGFGFSSAWRASTNNRRPRDSFSICVETSIQILQISPTAAKKPNAIKA